MISLNRVKRVGDSFEADKEEIFYIRNDLGNKWDYIREEIKTDEKNKLDISYYFSYTYKK